MKTFRSNIYPTTSLYSSKLRDMNKLDPFKLKILSKISNNKEYNLSKKTLRTQRQSKKYKLTNINTDQQLFEPNSKKFVYNFRDLYDTIIVDNLPKNKFNHNTDSISYYLDRIKYLEYNDNLIQLIKYKKPYSRNKAYTGYPDNKYQTNTTNTDYSYITTDSIKRSVSAKFFTNCKNDYNNFLNNTPRFNTINDGFFSEKNDFFRNKRRNSFIKSRNIGNTEFNYKDEKKYRFKQNGANKYNNGIGRINDFSENRKFERFNSFSSLNRKKCKIDQVYNLKKRINLKFI